MIKHESHPRFFLEPLQHNDGYSEANFQLNYQQLKEEYKKYGLLVSHYSFGEIAIQFMRNLHPVYFKHGFLSAAEIRQSVDYIANELLENSIKYSDNTATRINLELHVNKHSITVASTNIISEDRSKIFSCYLRRIIQSDTSEMYIKQLEKNLGDNNKSGLGLLTMIHDYRAKINWEFTPIDQSFRVLSRIIVELPTTSV